MGTTFLTAVRGRSGRLLHAAAAALTTPLLPADYLALFDPLLGGRWPAGRVESVRPETAEATTLVIRPGRGWGGFRAGQYVPVGVDIDGVLHWRTYSLSSAPGRPGEPFALTVKALPDGLVSGRLAQDTGPGTVLRLGPAQGDFTLPEPLPERTLFLTAGIGLTPVMSMLRALARRQGGRNASAGDVVLVHSAPDRAATVFGRELRVLSRRMPWLRVHLHHTRTSGRRLTPQRLSAVCPDWRERQTWTCGPGPMLDALRQHWHEQGPAVERRLHLERFRPALPAAASGAGAEDGLIRFQRTGVDVPAGAGVPLLRAGEAAGVAMPSGCRMGICFGCVASLVQGRVRDLRTGEITGEPGTLVQTCVCTAVGTVAVDL
ncbi:ferredoxin reductase [Phaeacidiphilus oryzae]|uniref:ferredoxin reductase n=1 Tax=Phaeacidiphilus oryzae TaxID=348818 RepID=UPI0009FFB8FD|nr:ferredoxin reductase [Phaeacidiphilus oryzae]